MNKVFILGVLALLIASIFVSGAAAQQETGFSKLLFGLWDKIRGEITGQTIDELLLIGEPVHEPATTTSEPKITEEPPLSTQDLTACGTLSTPNQLYTLDNDVSSAGTCFTISAERITLDCQGFSIEYSQSTSGQGIFITSHNATIVNCEIIQGTSTVSSNGIFITSSWNNITSNQIYSTGSGSSAIVFSSPSSFNTVSDNLLHPNGSSSYAVHFSTPSGDTNNNTFFRNVLFSSDTAVRFGDGSTGVGGNSFFDNLINATTVTSFPGFAANNWNTTEQAGTNVIGRRTIGGNFYANPSGTGFSETCTDADGDVICDSSYDVAAAFNTDYLPLADYINISSCGTLSSSGDYILTQDVSSSGTCFTIAANNVTLDCQGFTINYSQSSAGFGINIPNYNLTTIDNCNIVQDSFVFNFAGINISSNSGTVLRNINITFGTGGSAVGTGILIHSSSNNNLTNITIITTQNNHKGINLEFSSNNLIENVNVTAVSGTDCRGIVLGSSPNNVLTNIFTRTTSDSCWGILMANSNNSRLTNVTSIYTGEQRAAVQLSLSSNNSITNIKAITTASSSNSIVLDSNSDDNSFYDVNATATGFLGTGIFINTSSNNKFNLGTIFAESNIAASDYMFVGFQSIGNNMTNFTFAGFNGSIRFPQSIIIPSDTDVSTAVLNITHNRAFLNSASLSFLNVPAVITLTVTNLTNPQPLVDFQDDGSFEICDSLQCSEISYDNATGIFVFNVSSFTTYSSNETHIPQGGSANVSSCRNLDSPNTIYTLNQSVNSSGTCFTLSANNVTLDCQGFLINFSQNVFGRGVEITGSNSTVKNCLVVPGNLSTPNLKPMMINGSSGNAIFNNTINSPGTSSSGPAEYPAAGIFIFGRSGAIPSRNLIENNTVNSSGSALYFNADLTINSPTGNNVNDNDLTATFDTIYSERGAYTNFTSNRVTSTGSDINGAIFISSGDGNVLISNNITSGSNVVQISTSSNLLFNNRIAGGGGGSTSLRVEGGNNNIFVSNSIIDADCWGIKAGGYTGHVFNNTIINMSAAGTCIGATRSYIMIQSGVNPARLNLTNTTFFAPFGNLRFPQTIVAPPSLDDKEISIRRLNITFNRVFLNVSASDSSNISFLNVSAVIALDGLNLNNPQTIVDFNDDGTFEACNAPQCNNLSYSGGTFVFNVSSFTTYSVQETEVVLACGNLNSPNTLYNLTQNVNSSGTCFNIMANNVTLNCQGFSVNYSQNAPGSGINITGYNLTTIIGCNIFKGDLSMSSSPGIIISSSKNNTLNNNSISIAGTSSPGISISSGASNTLVSNNINSTESRGIQIISGSFNNFTSNVVLSTNDIGLFLSVSPSNSFNSNAIASLNSMGAQLAFSSSDNIFTSNNITGGSEGLMIRSLSNGNILNNTLILGRASYLVTINSISNNITGTIFSAANGSVNYPQKLTIPNDINVSLNQLNISFNRTFLNSTGLAFLNTSASVTFMGLTSSDPRAIVDFQDDGTFEACNAPQCNELSYSGGTFVFNVSSFTTYSSQETVADTTPPQVFDLRPTAGSSFIVNEVIEIAANATDDNPGGHIFVNITLPNSSIQKIVLSPAVNDKYNASFTIPSLSGTYNITFVVNDSSNNVNSTERTYFTASEATSLSSCGNLTAENTTYTLTSNVNSQSACFRINASRVTLNCNGFSINFSQSQYGEGISVMNANETTIKNCRIHGENRSLTAFGIFYNVSSGNLAINNSIRIFGNSAGIITLDSSFNNISENNISAEGDSAAGIFLGISDYAYANSENLIRGNTIWTNSSSFSAGIWTFYSTRNSVINNNFTSLGVFPSGIFSQSDGNNSVFVGNRLTSSGEAITSIDLDFTKNATIENNVIGIVSTGSVSAGILLHETSSSSIFGNNITTTGDNARGMQLQADASNNTIRNNRITTNDTNGIAIRLVSGPSRNLILNNTFNTTNTGAFGLSFTGISNNTLSENIFITSAAVDLNLSSSNNTILRDQAMGDYDILTAGLVIATTGKGNLSFINQSMRQSGANLSADIIIGNNSVFVNSALRPGFNTTALITLLGIISSNPQPIVDFQDDSTFQRCNPPQCNEVSYSGGTFVFDVSGFTTYSSNETSIADTTNPQVFDLRPTAGSPFNTSQTIELSANVTDNDAVGIVRANVTLPNGTINQITLTNAVGNKYNNSFTIPSLSGRYNVTFVVTDASSNVNSTERTYFNASEIATVTNVDVTGTWNGLWDSDVFAESGEFTAVVEQSGSDLTGTLDVPFLGIEDSPLNGTVIDHEIIFGDVAGSVTFNGTVADSETTASGDYVFPDFGDSGTWTATKETGGGGGSGGGGGGGGGSGGGSSGGGGGAIDSEITIIVFPDATASSPATAQASPKTTEATGIIKVLVRLKNAVKDLKITIKPESSGPPLKGTEKLYKYLSITAENARAEDIEEVEIEFEISRQWLTQNGFSREHVLFERYSGGWEVLPLQFVSETNDFYRFKATSRGLSTFAIAADKPASSAPSPPETKPAPEKEIGSSILWIVAIIALASILVVSALLATSARKKKSKAAVELNLIIDRASANLVRGDITSASRDYQVFRESFEANKANISKKDSQDLYGKGMKLYMDIADSQKPASPAMTA